MQSPLLEDVNLAGARGVLVNITASAGLKMKEYHEVMNTIKAFTAEDAMVIVGTVIDEAMEDRLRVTMVATGLGGAAAKARTPRLEVVEPMRRSAPVPTTWACDRRDRSTTTVSSAPGGDPPRARADAERDARRRSIPSDIPAFLRKQAD